MKRRAIVSEVRIWEMISNPGQGRTEPGGVNGCVVKCDYKTGGPHRMPTDPAGVAAQPAPLHERRTLYLPLAGIGERVRRIGAWQR